MQISPIYFILTSEITKGT